MDIAEDKGLVTTSLRPKGGGGCRSIAYHSGCVGWRGKPDMVSARYDPLLLPLRAPSWAEGAAHHTSKWVNA